MRYAHTFLFICPNCSLPTSTSRITDYKNFEEIEGMLLRAKCEYCEQSSEFSGLTTKSHWATNWDDSTELMPKIIMSMKFFARIDTSIDHQNKDGRFFVHTLVFGCPDCHLPVVIARLSPHKDRQAISSEAQNIICPFCEESFRMIVATAREHYVAVWTDNVAPLILAEDQT